MGIFDKLRNKNNVPEEESSALRQADRVSGIPFPAYKGREPYIFISYAHVRWLSSAGSHSTAAGIWKALL